MTRRGKKKKTTSTKKTKTFYMDTHKACLWTCMFIQHHHKCKANNTLLFWLQGHLIVWYLLSFHSEQTKFCFFRMTIGQVRSSYLTREFGDRVRNRTPKMQHVLSALEFDLMWPNHLTLQGQRVP